MSHLRPNRLEFINFVCLGFESTFMFICQRNGWPWPIETKSSRTCKLFRGALERNCYILKSMCAKITKNVDILYETLR